MTKMPRKGDRVYDTYLNDKPRWGTVVGWAQDGQDTDCVKVQWDDHEPNLDPEEIEYEGFFTQNNCGNGRWCEEKQCWCIEPSGDELPASHPMTQHIRAQLEAFNLRLLQQRMGSNWNYPLEVLEARAKDYREKADRVGKRDPYYNFYNGWAEDYTATIAHRKAQTSAEASIA